ncbi:MAG: SPOR domain-containing protein [Albidovulum sp.]|jgi:hypothetical protein|uniref:SPOR domain-containing protein n=1 Tax=Albidovulum sp. TaxID=1872424 RepID=UPI0030339845
MADADYDEFGGYGGFPEDMRGSRGPASRGVRAQKWVNGAGAVTSVALILGLGVWGYDLAVRDVRGIPVIRALEGPARVAPDNPGGELASYQGMAVNKIAADGTAGEAADQLTLAPRPEGLADDDQPMGALSASAEADLSDPLAPVPAAAMPAPAPDAAGAVPVLASLDAGEVLSGEPLPDGPSEDLLGGELPAIETPAASVDAISADVPGVAQSLRPASRPSSRPAAVVSDDAGDAGYDAIAEAAAAAVAEALGAPAAALDVASATLAEGTRLVQIGAYPDEAQARLEWDRTATRFGALMDGKRRVIEPAVSGGATFYRLRVEGFADIDDARRFCEVFKAEGAECVPTAVR